MFLAACNNSTPTTSTPQPEPTTEANSAPATNEVSTEDHSQPAAGGQVVEAGKYHLEFVPEP